MILPAETHSILGLQVSGQPEYAFTASGELQIGFVAPIGTLYLDQLTASYGGVVDQTVPTISLSAEGTTLTAKISDEVDGMLSNGQVAVTYDGKPLSAEYESKTGTLTAALPEPDGCPHRISVFARDASGNIGRASWEIAAGEDWTPVFSDTQGYWAAAYVDYLYTSGVTTGYADGSFKPNANITRGQMAKILYNLL